GIDGGRAVAVRPFDGPLIVNTYPGHHSFQSYTVFGLGDMVGPGIVHYRWAERMLLKPIPIPKPFYRGRRGGAEIMLKAQRMANFMGYDIPYQPTDDCLIQLPCPSVPIGSTRLEPVPADQLAHHAM